MLNVDTRDCEVIAKFIEMFTGEFAGVPSQLGKYC
jgi:hypothetical protein